MVKWKLKKKRLQSKRLKKKLHQPVVVVHKENKMLLKLELSIEEVNEVLAALKVGLVEKIKAQAIAQLQAAPAEVPVDAE